MALFFYPKSHTIGTGEIGMSWGFNSSNIPRSSFCPDVTRIRRSGRDHQPSGCFVWWGSRTHPGVTHSGSSVFPQGWPWEEDKAAFQLAHGPPAPSCSSVQGFSIRHWLEKGLPIASDDHLALLLSVPAKFLVLQPYSCRSCNRRYSCAQECNHPFSLYQFSFQLIEATPDGMRWHCLYAGRDTKQKSAQKWNQDCRSLDPQKAVCGRRHCHQPSPSSPPGHTDYGRMQQPQETTGEWPCWKE